MKTLLLMTGLALMVTGCDSLQLKTRDDVRSSESAPKQKGAGKEKPAGPAAATSAPEQSPDEQMRSLNDRVDQVEHQVTQADVNAKTERDEAAKQAALRDQKVAALEEEIKKLEGELQSLNEQVNKPKPAPPADPAAYLTEGDDLVTGKKYKEAIVAYQKYRDALPKGPRYAEATFKIGTSFQELGMKDESKAFYEEVVTKHAKSPFAKQASKKLKTLK